MHLLISFFVTDFVRKNMQMKLLILKSNILSYVIVKGLNLYLTCLFRAFTIQQQIKILCQKMDQWGYKTYDLVENIVGKGEIACYKQFLLFPQCFQKLFVVYV